MTAFGHRVIGWRPRVGRQVVGDAGAGERHQGLGRVAGLFLNIVRVDGHQARVLGPRPEVGLLPQAPQILLKMGVEEDVEKRVEAGRERANDQEDKLDDLGADEGEVQQGGKRQEGHGAVKDTVGEEQQGDVLHHRAVPDVLQVSLLQVAVELGVGDGHHEEAKGVEQDQRDHVARGAGRPEGQRQAERGGAVLAAAQQGHRGDGQRQHRAQQDDGFQAGKSFRFEFGRAFHREPTLQGCQSQQEHGRLRSKNGQEPDDLATHALLPPRAVPREAAEGDRVHAGQHGAGDAHEHVHRRDQPDEQFYGGNVQGGSEHRGRHQGVASEGQHGNGPHSNSDQPAPEQVLTEFEGACTSKEGKDWVSNDSLQLLPNDLFVSLIRTPKRAANSSHSNTLCPCGSFFNHCHHRLPRHPGGQHTQCSCFQATHRHARGWGTEITFIKVPRIRQCWAR